MSSRLVAETRFRGQRPGGVEVTIELRVHEPVQTRASEWTCLVELNGLDAEGAPIVGGDAVQSLCLALGFAASMLRDFVAGGGTLRFDDDDATEVPLEAYFGPFLQSDHTAG
jgi:hypothetical protein